MLVFFVVFVVFTLTSLRHNRLSQESGMATLLRCGRLYIIVVLGLGLLTIIAAAAPELVLATAALLCAGLVLHFLVWLYHGPI